jgi:hypothetical protein
VRARPCKRCRLSVYRSFRSRDGQCIATGMSKWTRPITPCRRSICHVKCGCVGIYGSYESLITGSSKSPCTSNTSPVASARRGNTWLRRRSARSSVALPGCWSKVRRLGPQSGRWGEAVLRARGIEGVRVLQGLLSLAKGYPGAALEKACAYFGALGDRTPQNPILHRPLTFSPDRPDANRVRYRGWLK